MDGWRFPSLDAVDYVSTIDALSGENRAPVKRQHLVSKAILRGFAGPVRGSQGLQLSRFDISKRKELDPKGLNACGTCPSFVSFASGSAEILWQEVETKLKDAISSLESRAPGDGLDSKTIKDAIALHLVRSFRYLRIHKNSFSVALEGTRSELLTRRRTVLERTFRDQHGIEAAGDEALDMVVGPLLEKWKARDENGAMFRVGIERAFEIIRKTISPLHLEIIHAPPGHEYIISDAPAFTFRHERGGSKSLQMAIGDSNGLAMPLSRRCLVAVAPRHCEIEATPEMMHEFNCIQVQLAERQIYYRPGNSLARQLIEIALDARLHFRDRQ